MNKAPVRIFRRKIAYCILGAFLLLSGAAYCQAAAYVPGSVNCANYTGNARAACELKDNFVFDVTSNWTAADEYGGVPNITTDNPITKKHWFVSGAVSDSILNSNLRCDGTVVSEDSYYYNNPCGTNSNHTDDYIKSDDLSDDEHVSPAGREFTIQATSSVTGRTISSLRIEWANNTTAAAPTVWQHGRTCWASDMVKNGGYCKICREGTLCANGFADISSDDLVALGNSTSNRLWFRVIMTDCMGQSLTIGEDYPSSDPYSAGWTSAKGIPLYQSKYHQFIICDTGCSSTCGALPTMGNLNVTNANCAGGNPYTFSWTLNRLQTAYLLNVVDTATHTAVFSSPIAGTTVSPSTVTVSVSPATLRVGGGGVLLPDHQYTWEVRAQDNVAAPCRQWSTYMNGPAFTTCSVCSAAPTLANSGATVANPNFCGVADPSSRYRLNWNYAGMPGGAAQSQAVVTVRNAATIPQQFGRNLFEAAVWIFQNHWKPGHLWQPWRS
jgi:hypothetical protein